MIESEELVTAALAAGASSRVGDSAAVRDAYAGLKALTLRVLHRSGPVSAAAVKAVEAGMADADDGRQELVTALAAVNAGADTELVVAAQRLLELTDPVGTAAGNYQVVARETPINLEAGWRTLTLGTDWTKHAEGKALAALASCGVLGSLLYTLVKSAQPRSTAVVVSALISLALVLAAGACSSLALRPRARTPGEQNSPLFYDHIARKHEGPQSYRPVLLALSRDPEAFLGAIADQIWSISRTTRAKYLWAGRALILLLLALLSVATTAVLTIAVT